MPETEPNWVDFSTAREPAHAIDLEADETAGNPNLKRKHDAEKTSNLQEKQQDDIPPGERMIQETWMRGGR